MSLPVPPEPTSVSPQPPAGKKPGNPLGLVGLILAVVAFVFAVIPATSFVAWLFAIAGIVLSIIGLTRKGRPKGFAIAGIIVAPIAWIIAIIVAVGALVSGAVNAIDDGAQPPAQSEEAPGETEEAPEEGSPAAESGSRDDPYALGTTASFDALFGGDSWDVVVAGPLTDVTSAVAETNQFNPAPTFGAYYALPITLTYHGEDSGDPSFAFSYGLVSSAGQSYDSTLWVGEPPAGANWVTLYDVGELYDGASATATIVFDAEPGFQGTLALDRIFNGEGKSFFAVQ